MDDSKPSRRRVLLIVTALSVATASAAPAHAETASPIYTVARPQLGCPHGGFLFEPDGPSGSLAVAPTGTLSVSGAGVFTVAPDGRSTCQPAARFSAFVGGGSDYHHGRDDAGDVAFAPDGSLLVADFSDDYGNHVVRVTDSESEVVKGTGGSAFTPFGSEQAYQYATSGTAEHRIAPLRDGSLLIADRHRERVFRVAPDGTVTVAAGTGTPTGAGNGGQATAAGIDPAALAALPDGGYLIADDASDTVRRVGPDGVITKFGTTGAPPIDIAVAPDGSVVVADDNQHVSRLAPDGTFAGLVAGGGASGGGFFGGDGRAATSLKMHPDSVAVDSAGGVYIYDSSPIDGRVRYVPPADPASAVRPGVAISGLSERNGRFAVTYQASESVALRLDAIQAGSPAASATGSGAAGTIALTQPLGAGVDVLTLTVTDANGHATVVTVPVVSGGLSMSLAHRIAFDIGDEEVLENADPVYVVGRCRRQTPSRVSCAMIDTDYKYYENHPHDHCDWIAVLGLRQGLIYQGQAGCRARHLRPPGPSARIVSDYAYPSP